MKRNMANNYIDALTNNTIDGIQPVPNVMVENQNWNSYGNADKPP